MQVKYGESVAGGHLAYHVDTFNSVLHMAVAIAGTRTLYLQHLEGGDVVKCASDLVLSWLLNWNDDGTDVDDGSV